MRYANSTTTTLLYRHQTDKLGVAGQRRGWRVGEAFVPRKRWVRKAAGQRGAAMIVGIILMTVLLLGAAVFGYFALTQKQSATLVAEPPEVSADDLLMTGNSNNELTIDYRIIAAGLERDKEQQEAARAVLDDKAQPVGDGVTTSTTVESERLSRLQTEYISEADRRLKRLNDTAELVDKLEVDQKPTATQYIGDEITALTGLKAKAAAETTKEAFLTDRDELDKEYVNYVMAASRVYMLLWANKQAALAEKVNVLGGKFQERLNEASNSGTSIASAQTLLNSYQTNKKTAKETSAEAIEAIQAVEPNTFNANHAVLETYYNKLVVVQNEIKKTSDTSKSIITEIRAFK